MSTTSAKIPVGVSQCLLGEPVRYDGGHKHDRYLTEVLSQYFHYRPVCPEVAVGLGIPRKPIRLVATDRGTRVRGIAEASLDVTEALEAEAERTVSAMPELSGYIFMQNSPSCGVFRMKRYSEDGMPVDSAGQGAYARRLIERMPLLPIEEAGRLNDAALRENFITRVFAYHDWQQCLEKNPSPAALVDFYSRYKYQVMAHHPASYQAIGRLLADVGKRDAEQVNREFIALFMAALQHKATRRGNTNAIMHLRGYLKGLLNADEQQELSGLIEQYRGGKVPLVVPLTLLKHYLRKVDNPYLQKQTFWCPHPENLGLRNVCTD
ncbi:DUF523 and DUF1722 domain-containing protein [Marinimicrobium sp. ABcell2]|uniref:YbgA family protein n=1 Tax=Marinimicrobium sp. ABcell2 TaxID=3069751 RepID=UPI0027B35D73|nr:DUF523 and DUF1722 domain-containing protein [Marinimicrobium sp. ABcell2]MDQ2077854.1 DUF523 and DUF1722 domain-containing protein [Marinimicrobium sp. ABcell2]